MTKTEVYELHEGKVGVKVKYLISDRNAAPDSLALISYISLYKRIKKHGSSERELRRGANNREALVDFYSLNQAWRNALIMKFGEPKEEARKSFFSTFYEPDPKAFDYFIAFRYDGDKRLPDDVIQTYVYNASVLNAVIRCKARRKDYIRAGQTMNVDIWASLSNDVNKFTDVAHTLPTTKDSLRYKVNKYAKEGYAAVVSGKYGTKNASKVKNEHQRAVIEELLNKHQNLNDRQISDIYNTIADGANWKTITHGTVAKVRRALDLYIYAGSRGLTEFNHNRKMQVTRKGPPLPMTFWTMDGWDVELLYQQQTKNAKGHEVTTYHHRHTMVVVLDMYNRYPIGYAIGTDGENPRLIRQALRNAVNHTQELFGLRYRTYQLQTDNYQIKHLTPLYSAIGKHFTPAKVGNSKAKPIENWFGSFNRDYFQAKLLPNWSGHNVDARRENQPNQDYLDKIKKTFPTESECRQQIIDAMEAYRAAHRQEFIEGWKKLPQEDRLPLLTADYLRWFGEKSRYTNRLTGSGLTPSIGGRTLVFDSFDPKFREYFRTDWLVRYDPEDLSHILVSNAKSKDGVLVEEIGTVEFVLEQKHAQPMALYDMERGDGDALARVFQFNKELEQSILYRNDERHRLLHELMHNNPALETLQKLLITDSRGQHKDQRISAQKADRTLPQPDSPEVDQDNEEYEIIVDPRRNY